MYSCIYKRKHYKKNIGEGSHTVTVLEKYLPPTTKRFKGSHTDNILENVFFRMRRGSNYELVVFLSCKLLPIPLSDIHHYI